MSQAIFTLEQLEAGDACDYACQLFQKIFGKEVVVDEKTALRVALLFNWEWGARLLNADGYDQFLESKTTALNEYVDKWNPYQAEQTAACKVAHEAYPNNVDYQVAIEPIYNKFNKSATRLRNEYKRALAVAWARAYMTGAV